MEIIEAFVGEGGVLHVENVPLKAGSRVQVVEAHSEGEAMTDEQWHTRLREFYGCLPEWDFEQFDRNYPEPIEPLFLTEEP